MRGNAAVTRTNEREIKRHRVRKSKCTKYRKEGRTEKNWPCACETEGESKREDPSSERGKNKGGRGRKKGRRRKRRRRRRRRNGARAMQLLHHLLHRFAARRRRYPVHARTSWGHHMLSLYCIGIPTAVPMQAYLAYVMFYRFSQSHRFIMISVSRVPCAFLFRFCRGSPPENAFRNRIASEIFNPLRWQLVRGP